LGQRLLASSLPSSFEPRCDCVFPRLPAVAADSVRVLVPRFGDPGSHEKPIRSSLAFRDDALVRERERRVLHGRRFGHRDAIANQLGAACLFAERDRELAFWWGRAETWSTGSVWRVRLALMDISSETVSQLIREQLPQWADLEVTPVLEQGNDNRTFRLGDELAVRLPSAEGYVAGVTKEDLCLPVLARYLSTDVPVPVATGVPSEEYPYPWSVRHWIVGTTLDRDPALDRVALAKDLGLFMRELRAVPPVEGPAAGAHSFYRGTHPSVYGDQVQQALGQLGNQVDVEACQAIWNEAVRTAWPTDPVWFHGDVAPGNLLTDRGRLAAVIDFGTCGVGDPACDLVIAWTVFPKAERGIFRDAAALPDDAWARGRGWALWKALVTLCCPSSNLYAHQARALEELVAEYRDAGR
jgi:aminoglycoside phosphotransferase (APT) family kinase protein